LTALALGAAAPLFAGSADLGIEKVAVPMLTDVGQVVTYTIVVQNEGPDPAEDVSVMDELPPGTVFLSATANTCEESAGTVLCNLQTMASGASAELTVVVTIQAVGNLENTASVTSPAEDPDPANNVSSFVVISLGSGVAGTGSSGGCALRKNSWPFSAD
jgi:uncharacterized repeat protein (TIGR01451 family)